MGGRDENQEFSIRHLALRYILNIQEEIARNLFKFNLSSRGRCTLKV